MNEYKLLPHDKINFAIKLGEITTILYYWCQLTIDEVEDVLTRSQIIKAMCNGNSALIDSFAFHIVNLIIKECSLKPNEYYRQEDHFMKSTVKGTAAEWCGYLIGLYIMKTSSSIAETFEKCSLQVLYDSYAMYHLVNEKKALIELFGLTLEEVL